MSGMRIVGCLVFAVTVILSLRTASPAQDAEEATLTGRVKIKGEIRAITGQQRMAGYMLAGLPVFVAGILTLIAPKYIGSFFNPVGPWTALPVCAVIGILFGFLVIQKVIQIEV